MSDIAVVVLLLIVIALVWKANHTPVVLVVPPGQAGKLHFTSNRSAVLAPSENLPYRIWANPYGVDYVMANNYIV